MILLSIFRSEFPKMLMVSVHFDMLNVNLSIKLENQLAVANL